MQSRLKFGIKGKLMGLLAGVTLVALSAACLAFVMYDRISTTEAKEASLSVLVDAVAQSALGPVAFGDAESARYVLDSIERERTARSAAIYGNDGARLTEWVSGESAPRPPESVEALPTATGIERGLLHVRRKIERDGNAVGELYAVFSTEDIDARTVHFLSIAALVLLIVFMAAWIIASFAQRVLTRPVDILLSAVGRVEREQDFSVRAQKTSDDELGSLTDSFNAMVAVIEQRDGELAAHRADLERRVAERTRDLDARNAEMRLVLDNVDQGFVTVGLDGVMQSERSSAFDRFFGAPDCDVTLPAHLEDVCAGLGDTLCLGFEELIADILPLELTLEQLPSRFETADGRSFVIEYRPIEQAGALAKLLVIVSDVTAQTARERADAAQAETIAMFESIMQDRSGFLDFFNEADRLMQGVFAGEAREVTLVMRDLHTLKGNFGIARMHRIAAEVHELESECIEAGECPSGERLAALRSHWQEFSERASTFLGDSAGSFSITHREHELLVAVLRAEGVSEETLTYAESLSLDACGPRLKRLAAEAERIADRLGLVGLRVDVTGQGVRLPPGSAWLWAALSHLVRNAVDHGLSGLRARAPKLYLSAEQCEDELVIEVRDNGAGVDWEAVRSKAEELGLSSSTQDDLVAALFVDRLSTRSEVTQISGRGVGLSSVKADVEAHGGSITVQSEPGQGTTFRIAVLAGELSNLPSASVLQPSSAAS